MDASRPYEDCRCIGLFWPFYALPLFIPFVAVLLLLYVACNIFFTFRYLLNDVLDVLVDMDMDWRTLITARTCMDTVSARVLEGPTP